MGYTFEMFDQIGRIGLPKGARVLDVGSQDITINDAREVDVINSFIVRSGGEPLEATLPAELPAREIYERAGFHYTCTDVDGRPGTVYVDLAGMRFPSAMREAFDLVVNVGTTEHLANPVGGFLFIHYCAKIGAIMFHDVPIFGWANHGLVNPTPKFWHALIGVNQYEVLEFTVRRAHPSIPRGNLFNAGWTYMNGDLEAESSLARVVLRRNVDRIFIPPFDAVLPANDALARFEFLRSTVTPFVDSGVYPAYEVEGHLLAFVGLPPRALPNRLAGRLLSRKPLRGVRLRRLLDRWARAWAVGR